MYDSSQQVESPRKNIANRALRFVFVIYFFDKALTRRKDNLGTRGECQFVKANRTQSAVLAALLLGN